MLKPLVGWFTGNKEEKAIENGKEKSKSETPEPEPKEVTETDLRCYMLYFVAFLLNVLALLLQASGSSSNCCQLIMSSTSTYVQD